MMPPLIYLLAVLGANFTATLFIPFPVFGQVALGTFIFGITFTQRDRMHSRGRPFVYKVIFLSAILNLIFLWSFKHFWGPPLVAWLEFADNLWLRDGFGNLVASSTRVFIASFVAIILAEATDTEVYHRLRHRSWLVRVSRSNAVSIPLDSMLFNLIAFAGIFPWPMLISIAFGEVIVKFSVGAVYALFRPPEEAAAPAAV